MSSFFTKDDFSDSESFNNPGNLADLSNDKYAMGKIGLLNVYETPEHGIAALCQVLESIQTGGASTVKDIIYGFVELQGNLIRTKTVYNNLKKERYLTAVQNIWGIDSAEKIDLTNEATRIVFAIIITELVQGRNIFNYDQFLKGCALSMELDPSIYEEKVNASTGLSIENVKSAAFNSPANPSITNGGSSLGFAFTSGYEQVAPMSSTSNSNFDTLTNTKSVNYNMRNSYNEFQTMPEIETINGIPKLLANMGFANHLIIDGKVVYVNDSGDKARLLDDRTYLVNYADGSPDNVIKSSTMKVLTTDLTNMNLGIVSNPLSISSQVAKLEKHIDKSSAVQLTVTKPLTTAHMILAAYRYR